MGSKPQIYHEKQEKELCALHALNNLFQVSVITCKCIYYHAKIDREKHQPTSQSKQIDLLYSR